MTLFIHRNAGGRCPCGAENATCGPPSDVVPVDQVIEEVAAVSGPLKKYKVKRGAFETVMKLSDEDAAKLGAGPDDVMDAASTIQPLAAADEGGDSDGPGDSSGDDQAAAADSQSAPESVQPTADSGDAGTEADGTAGQATADGQKEEAVTQPSDTATTTTPAKTDAAKAPAKRRTASANKARTSAATKAADGGNGGS